ncbi:hypothetical protein [Aquaspirillum serpens]|uniref:hypothetical protein n=1 Tax=Aquaspirillum serpens TaxID=190 RepID=UPI0003B3E276|nr:hypothetical protein [Aquaspirillum serpens]
MNNDTISIAGHLNQSRHKADLIFMPVLAVLFLASLGLATWYGTWFEAILIGLPAAAIPFTQCAESLGVQPEVKSVDAESVLV